MLGLLKFLPKALKFQAQMDTVYDALDKAEEFSGAAPGSKDYNEGARVTSAALGDDGTRPRELTHFADPLATAQPKSEARAAIVWADARFEDREDMPNLLFKTTNEIASDTFDAITARLAKDLRAVGWDYGGFESIILQSEENK